MEPWQQEALYRRQQERLPTLRCEACGEGITTEDGYFLERFGIKGYACSRCMDAARVFMDMAVL